MTPAELIRKALDLLSEEDRWVKGHLTGINANGDTTFCAVGAVMLSTEYSYKHNAVVPALAALNRDLPSDPTKKHCALAYFNDDPDTTHEDVILHFKKVLHELDG